MSFWCLNAPAKVNLFLSVGPVDFQNYHPIRTIFQAVSLFDKIEVTKTSGAGDVRFEGADIPLENTVTKAIRLFNEHAALPSLRIVIKKRIPSESGLGGGSSDAGVLLRFLRDEFANHLSDEFLLDLALKVGADVPFFLRGGRAKAEGYGQILTQLVDLPETWMLIGKPPVACSTPEAFRMLDQVEYEWQDFPEEDDLYNDFERVAPEECLQLKAHCFSMGPVTHR